MLQCPLDYDRGQLFSHNTVVFVINKTDHRNIVEKYRYITEHKTQTSVFTEHIKDPLVWRNVKHSFLFLC